MKKIAILYSVLLVLLLSCKPTFNIDDWQNTGRERNDSIPIYHEEAPDTIQKGIVFCIDDYYVEDFYQPEHYNYMQKMGIKMTYFICDYHILDSTRKAIIRKFYQDGHEIAFHGTHHIRATDYLKNHSIEEYINYEILPDLTLMKQDGYDITDFSYPYGSHTKELDSVLFSRYFYFIKLGSTSFWFYSKPSDKKIIHPFPLDPGYWERYNLNMDMVINFIDSANKANKIIMFYAHRWRDDDPIAFARFRMIMDYAKEKGFRFYTLQDLQKMDKDAAKIILTPDEVFPDKDWNDIDTLE